MADIGTLCFFVDLSVPSTVDGNRKVYIQVMGVLMSHNHSDTVLLFDKRFVASQDELYGYIASMLPRRNDADEVFQETSLKLLRNRNKYDTSRPFAPWAFSIALNEVRMFIRRNRRHGVMISEAMLVRMAEQQHRSSELLNESLERLSECLGKLSVEKRSLLERCYSGTSSIKTIALAMSIQPDTVYKQLERIRRILFVCMHAQLFEREVRDD